MNNCSWILGKSQRFRKLHLLYNKLAFLRVNSETYLGLLETSKMEHFAKTMNYSLQLSIFDICESHGYASVTCSNSTEQYNPVTWCDMLTLLSISVAYNNWSKFSIYFDITTVLHCVSMTDEMFWNLLFHDLVKCNQLTGIASITVLKVSKYII